MKRLFALVPVTVVAIVLFGGLVYTVLVVAQVSEPAATTVEGMTSSRLWATVTALLALTGVLIGGVLLAPPANRFGSSTKRLGTILTLGLGLIAVVNGGLVITSATGGPGTGNGVVGGAMGLVLGLLAIVLGGLAMNRSRAIT